MIAESGQGAQLAVAPTRLLSSRGPQIEVDIVEADVDLFHQLRDLLLISHL
jgi:hypothetical protein